MARFEIKTFATLADASSDVYSLVVEGWNELVQDGFDVDFRSCPFGRHDQVAAAFAAEEVVGVLCWRRDEPRGVWAVTLAYVEPSSRKQGAMRQLWGHMLTHREDRAAAAPILFNLHPENSVAATVVQRLGLCVQSVSFTA